MTKRISEEKIERSRVRFLATLFVTLSVSAVGAGCGIMPAVSVDVDKARKKVHSEVAPAAQKALDEGNYRQPPQDFGGGGGGH